MSILYSHTVSTGSDLTDSPGTMLPDCSSLPLVCFVHIPKTAGTSVTSAFERCYGPACFPAMTTLDYACYDDQKLASYRFFKGHAYRRDYERLPADTIRFTVLRDPVRRAISYYRYCRRIDVSHTTDKYTREVNELANSAGPVDFIYSDSPFVIEHIRFGQLRQFLTAPTLAELSHRQFVSRELKRRILAEVTAELGHFDYVLTCEALALSFPLLVRALSLPLAARAIAKENTSLERDRVDWLDIRRAMMDVNDVEFDCYEYVRKREQDWLVSELAHLI